MSSPRFCTSALSENCGLIVEPLNGASLHDLTQDDVAPLFREWGALLFRGFECSVDTFLVFTERFSRDFSTYKGGAFRLGNLDRQRVANNNTLFTTTGAGQSFPIPLHGEMYYFKNRPTLIWFFCAIPPLASGETTICDGHKIFERLSNETQDFFQKNPIKYLRHLGKDQWQQAFQTTDIDVVRAICAENDTTLTFHDFDSTLETEFICSAVCMVDGREVFINNVLAVYLAEWAFRNREAAVTIQGLELGKFPLVVRMADGSPIPEKKFDEVYQIAEALTANVAWHQNELLMINNRTHLHGRRTADGSERRIYVRMGEPLFNL
jgi:alpha-ketoglutarate-dependent taurine dioxygenase